MAGNNRPDINEQTVAAAGGGMGGVFNASTQSGFKKQLNRVYTWYIGGFLVFIVVLAVLEQMGLPRNWIGFIFLIATVLLYAGIGFMSRTSDAAEYYVAGRRVPAMYNGMATGADWMSAASFIGMAGTLYLTGFGGLAFILGWTGGYVLVALFLAPYLRKFGQFTIPDFLGARYEGNLPRFLGIVAAILCSFTYVVAQIYGVGLITARLSGLAFEVGIFVGLGGILVCSFLGGMRAVTWTQVAQYIILIVAYMIPVVWLAVKQTGVPVPQAIYGYQLEKVSKRGDELRKDPKELEVAAIFKARAAEFDAKLKDVPASMAADKAAAEKKLADLRTGNALPAEIAAAEKALAALPANEADARKAYAAGKATNTARSAPLAGMPNHAQIYAGNPDGTPAEQKTYNESRRNFIALVFCLMVGTAALPHILMRYYTTPSVKQARDSVTWSLFFIFLLYFTAPALAVLVKYEVFNVLVGTPFTQLPAWIANWSAVDPTLLSVVDVNKDGIFQLSEMRIGGDIIVLATPEIGGLPYVISGPLDRRRLVADDRQRPVARPLLQDDRPERRGVEAGGHLQGLARGGRDRRGGGRSAKAGRHPVPGVGGILVRRSSLLSSARAGHLLEAGQQVGRVARHVRRPGDDFLLHGHDPALDAKRLRGYLSDRPVVGHPADLRRPVRRADRLCGDHHRQPPDRATSTGHAGSGGACALSGPEARLTRI